VIHSARVVNEAMPEHVAQILVNHAKENKIRKILIIGLAFKGDPETKDLRNSPSIKILDILLKKNYDIRVYDNIVTKKDINQKILPLFYSQNDEWYPEMVCVLNNHQDNYNTVNKILNFVKQITLFDPWYICTALYDDKRIKFIKTLSKTWVK
jgi:UDP-N-acetyl-D-mannosaminuronic acid dehydrogenase